MLPSTYNNRSDEYQREIRRFEVLPDTMSSFSSYNSSPRTLQFSPATTNTPPPSLLSSCSTSISSSCSNSNYASSSSSGDPMQLSNILNPATEDSGDTDSSCSGYQSSAAEVYTHRPHSAISAPLLTLEPRFNQEHHNGGTWPIQTYNITGNRMQQSSPLQMSYPPTPTESRQNRSPASPQARRDSRDDKHLIHTSNNHDREYPPSHHHLPPSPVPSQQPSYFHPQPHPHAQPPLNINSNTSPQHHPYPPPPGSHPHCHAKPPKKKGQKTPTPAAPHPNTPYTQEQVDFIHYGRETLKLGWKDLRKEFQKQFPLQKSLQGIQGRWYRAQKKVLINPKTGSYSHNEDSRGAGHTDEKDEGGDWNMNMDEGEWEFTKVRIRDRERAGIKDLGLKYELVDMEGLELHGTHSSSSDRYMSELGDRMDETVIHGGEAVLDAADLSDIDTTRDEKNDGRCGAERLLDYQWGIIKEADRERAAAKVQAKRGRRKSRAHLA